MWKLDNLYMKPRSPSSRHTFNVNWRLSSIYFLKWGKYHFSRNNCSARNISTFVNAKWKSQSSNLLKSLLTEVARKWQGNSTMTPSQLQMLCNPPQDCGRYLQPRLSPCESVHRTPTMDGFSTCIFPVLLQGHLHVPAIHPAQDPTVHCFLLHHRPPALPNVYVLTLKITKDLGIIFANSKSSFS